MPAPLEGPLASGEKDGATLSSCVQQKFYPIQPSSATATPRSDDDQAQKPIMSPPMTLSRENWSHLVGASTETIIRTLGDLRAEGLIKLTASEITLFDIEKLTRLKH